MSIIGSASSTARLSHVTLERGHVLAAKAGDPRVLIVGGNRRRAAATAEALAVAGYATASVTFAEARSLAQSYLPDLVVIDFASAARSDAGAIAELQEGPAAGVPTVALVRRSDARLRHRARRAGIFKLTSIFASAEDLLRTLDSVLRAADQRRTRLRRGGDSDG